MQKGVPQVSDLGTLFFIFIYDLLHNNLASSFKQTADFEIWQLLSGQKRSGLKQNYLTIDLELSYFKLLKTA